VRAQPLYHSPCYPERIQLIELGAGTELQPLTLQEETEIFVISGQFADEGDVHPAHSWLLLPPGGVHRPKSAGGTLLYARRGGIRGARGARVALT